MIGIEVHRTLEGPIAGLGLADVGSRGPDQGRQDKSAASGVAHVFGWTGDFRHLAHPAGRRFSQGHQRFQCPKRRPWVRQSPIQR